MSYPKLGPKKAVNSAEKEVTPELAAQECALPATFSHSPGLSQAGEFELEYHLGAWERRMRVV